MRLAQIAQTPPPYLRDLLHQHSRVQESFVQRRFENLSFLDDLLIAATTAARELEEIRAFTSKEPTPQEQERRKRLMRGLEPAGDLPAYS